jgi:hypothetical protein
MEQLKAIGIDVGLLISGLFGAVLLMSKNAAEDLRTTILSIIGGAASANYMTPILLDLFNLDTPNANYGIAFLLGFLGLKGIEMVTEKLFGKKIIEEPKPKRKARKPRQKKTPVKRK